MNPETLQPWRDLAVILLCLEAAVLFAIPGVALFFAQKYLRRFRHWLKTPLLRAQVYTLKAQELTQRASNSVAGVPVSMQMLGVRARETARRMLPGGSKAS